MIQVGDKLPAGTLQEYIEVEGEGCSIGPNAFDIHKATAGKTVAIFALPGAYTPTCSAKHVPGYVAKADELKLSPYGDLAPQDLGACPDGKALGPEPGAHNEDEEERGHDG